jgi:hypothetical protein
MPAWLTELEAEIAGRPAQAAEEPETHRVELPAEPQELEQVAAEAEPAEVAEVDEAEAEPVGQTLAPPEAPQEVEEERTEAQTEQSPISELAEVETAPGESEEAVEPIAEPEPEALAEEVPPIAESVEAKEPGAEVDEETGEAVGLEAEPEEQPDWVRELEGPAPEEEPSVSVEAPGLVPSDVAPEGPPPEPALEEPQPTPAAAPTTAAQEHLSRGRSYLADHALDEAVREYEHLLGVSSLHAELIADLERETEAQPQHAALLRVLGDAYLRTGELQKALRTYQQALHSL